MTDQIPSTLHPPLASDSARVERTLEELREKGYSFEGDALALLGGAFGNSPYLCRLALRGPDILRSYFERGAEAAADAAYASACAIETMDNRAEAMKALRQAKQQIALVTALADLSGHWPLEKVTRALSLFADRATESGLRFLLRERYVAAGQPVPEMPEADSGLIVLAMGKHGAFELNYSSDIDLVVFYDHEKFPFDKRGDKRGAAVDIVKGLIQLLDEVTGDGYVFRVDLRLRPDAGATQIAISTDAALAYYEEMGQNWERAAMIKARVCAGDPEIAASFTKYMEPFVWRRNLDFAAIEDIHSIKRQINAHGKHGAITVPGHNIKLGQGGIREVEFFVQTQQLILGGRDSSLRSRRTVETLDALAARGLITAIACHELKQSYRFLRTLEHRLQMVEDQQTHSLPKDGDGLKRIACFMGYAGTGEFAEATRKTLETVQRHYVHLFEKEEDLTASEGNLVFTGVEDDPGTIATLQEMGFKDPSRVASTVRQWHHGRIRAMRSARARELLTKLMPSLLGALADTVDPDAAFAQFDHFFSALPSGVQILSLFSARRELLQMIAEIVGSAPVAAMHLARSPETLDALLDPEFLNQLPSKIELNGLFQAKMAQAADYEQRLNDARRFAREQIFRVSVQTIEGQVTANDAGPAFANIAEAIIAGLLPVTEDELAQTAGRIKGGAFVVVAMGKLGGREMTAASDLDLIFVYDHPEDSSVSDGKSHLPASMYYARLAQRFIAALTAQTSAGGLYEVDMRLRPTGNQGPVAVSLEAFSRYHAGESWTWERLAMTRARVIAGPEELAARVEAVIRKTLTSVPAEIPVLKDAAEMRAKLLAQFPGKSAWDLKFTPGGLVDIEFVAQALQLIAARGKPGVLDTNTVQALDKLGRAGALAQADADTLMAAADFEQALTQVLRIAVDHTFDPETATQGSKSLLTLAGGVDSFEKLEKRLGEHQARVRAVFNKIFALSPAG